MKKTAQYILKHPLISGSSIIVVGTFTANIFNYLYNLSMGRLLSVSDYGLLTSLNSLFVLIGIFGVAFTKLFARYTAQYEAKKKNKYLSSFIKISLKSLVFFAVALFVIFTLLSPIIARFLNINNLSLIILTNVSFFFSLLFSLPAGVLQGKLKFISYSALTILQPLTKFIFAITLVFLGYGLFGAISSITIATLLIALIGYQIIKKYVDQGSETKIDKQFTKNFRKYTANFILTSIGIALLSNTDILLVRHFFEADTSGHYAALSLMGKAIFYLTMPINFAFFPLIAQKKEKKEKLLPTLMMTLGAVTMASVALAFVYFAFPSLVLSVFFPSQEYQVLRSYLGIFSLYILVFSLVYIMNNFFLSIGRSEIYKFTLLAAVIQIVLIVFFHSSLYQIIGILFASNLLLFFIFLVYYWIHGRD